MQESKRLMLIVLITVEWLTACNKESLNSTNPVTPSSSFQLDSVVTLQEPSSVCAGCGYLIKGVTEYYYNADGKVWKTKTKNLNYRGTISYFYFDSTIFELISGTAYLTRYAWVDESWPEKPIFEGRKNLGPVNSFSAVSLQPNLSKTYTNTLPTEPGAIDTLEVGITDVAYDLFGRTSRYGYRYFQTLLLNKSYPLQRKIIAFPYTLNNENDKDGLLRSVFVMNIIDDDQQKNSAQENWIFKNNFYTTLGGINYYSPYFTKEEKEVSRTDSKILNPPFLYYQELPETFLRLKTVTKSYATKDTTTGWSLYSNTFFENYEIQLQDGLVKSYKTRNQLQQQTFAVTYYFHKIGG